MKIKNLILGALLMLVVAGCNQSQSDTSATPASTNTPPATVPANTNSVVTNK